MRIREYILDDTPLGVGGMGKVYKGVSGTGVPVAVKEILPEFVLDMEYRSRLDREIKILKKLNNDGIVKIYDDFEEGDNLYIVMELVDGRNIEKYVEEEGPIDRAKAVEYMIEVLDTMQYIHENGIIHRDIKPNNIMIRKNGSICVLDFGIAKDTSYSGGTLFGTAIGTSGYMSPEQADGMAVDHRTDIYSLGCLFFFMLTGEHAFPTQQSELNTRNTIMTRPIPRLRDYVRGIPDTIQEILDKATDKNMLRRYQTAREMMVDLNSLSGGSKTIIDTKNRMKNISISIGREGCDLTVFPLKGNVSRHHATIQYKIFTGGEFLVYNDCSSNGTVIDGKYYSRGMTCPIPMSAEPTIYLAKDPECRLNWDEVRNVVKNRVRQLQIEENERAVLQPQQFMPPQARANNYPPQQPAMQRPQPFHQGGGGRTRRPSSRSMTFMEAVSTVFNKYAVFSGRASLSEFWWFVLFNFLCCVVLSILATQIGTFGAIVYTLYLLGVFVPGLAVSFRRLHDADHSAWNLLWSLLPFIGAIILIIYYCQKSTPGPNKYGE